jgi:hypothetical protein
MLQCLTHAEDSLQKIVDLFYDSGKTNIAAGTREIRSKLFQMGVQVLHARVPLRWNADLHHLIRHEGLRCIGLMEGVEMTMFLLGQLLQEGGLNPPTRSRPWHTLVCCERILAV